MMMTKMVVTLSHLKQTLVEVHLATRVLLMALHQYREQGKQIHMHWVMMGFMKKVLRGRTHGL